MHCSLSRTVCKPAVSLPNESAPRHCPLVPFGSSFHCHWRPCCCSCFAAVALFVIVAIVVVIRECDVLLCSRSTARNDMQRVELCLALCTLPGLWSAGRAGTASRPPSWWMRTAFHSLDPSSSHLFFPSLFFSFLMLHEYQSENIRQGNRNVYVVATEASPWGKERGESATMQNKSVEPLKERRKQLTCEKEEESVRGTRRTGAGSACCGGTCGWRVRPP